LKDAELPLLLMKKLMTIPNSVEMARVSGVPVSFLTTRGQQIKFMSQVYRRGRAKGYIVPVFDESEIDDESYDGARVIEPMSGYYEDPIVTLDYASLYPTIIIAHNLCYTTRVDRKTIDRLGLVEGRDYTVAPGGNTYVTRRIRRGIVPDILED